MRAPSIEVALELAELIEPEAAMFALDLAIFEGGVLDDYLDERGACCQATSWPWWSGGRGAAGPL